MDKLRKIFTILAIVGTVLLTALFYYKPVRDMLRERRKQDVSLAQEVTVPLDSTEEVVGERAQITTGVPEAQRIGKEISEVALTVQSATNTASNGQTEVTLWQSYQGDCYFFLPGFAEDAQITLSKAEHVGGPLSTNAGSLQIGNNRIHEGDTIKDIKWGEVYELTIYDSEEQVILTAPVSFLCSSKLPVLTLTTESGTMDYINAVKGNEEAGNLVLLDENGVLLSDEKMVSLSGRGNSTWGLAKKPYQFKLDKKVDLLNFGQADEYSLLANGYDETRLRNQLVMELAVELGMSYVPQGQMVDVYVNGNYYGNYYLCEKIQVDSERVDIFDLEKTAKALYLSEEMSQLPQATNEDGTRKWVEISYEEEDFSGGYLLEREMHSRFQEELCGFVTNQEDHYALKSPVHASMEQVNYIADLMQEFQDAVEQKDGIHPVTGKHYSEYIDVNSFVQKYLVEEVSKNYDGGVTSSYFYKPQDSVSTKIFAGPVWDYDVAFGNCNLDEIVSNPMGITQLNNHIYGTDVFACLYAKEEFYQQTVTLYEQKVLPYLNYLLEERIDTLVEASRDSARMDSIRWANLVNRYQYYDNYDNSVRYLKYFIEQRRNFLNEVWLEGAVYHNVSFKIDGESWQILCVKDGETAGVEPVPFREGSLFISWISEKRNVPYDPYKPVYEDMSFNATWQELAPTVD